MRAWAELAGAWSLAIAYPMFQNIASGPEALTHLGAGTFEIAVAVVILVCLVPTVLLAVERAISRFFGERAGLRLHALILGALAALIVWAALDRGALPGALETALLVTALAGVAWLYLRTAFTRALAGFVAIAIPVVVVTFLISEPVRSELPPRPASPQVEAIEAETPVVLIVFDEWPLATIESAPGRIDPVLFPGMAELARRATWYPNAITDARMTLMALPTIMTGRDPDPARRSSPPSAAAHPENLCTILAAGGYEIAGVEPYSNFCGGGDGLAPSVAGLIGLGGSAGIAPGELVSGLTGSIAGLYRVGSMWEGREERLREALAGLKARPGTFTFVHTLLPHFPWRVGPDGQRYELPADADAMAVAGQSQWVESPARVDYAHQRMLLQAQFADRLIGAAISRLERRGEWDEALFIVAADHGATIRPGRTRRGLTEETFAPIASVPLFVKFPGRSGGRRDPRFARTADIAATVHDVLGVESEFEPDGDSLLRPPSGPAPDVLAVQAGPNRFELPTARFLAQRERLVAERNRLFGAGSAYALAGRAGLIGRPIAPGSQSVAHEYVEPGLIDSFYAPAPANMAVFDARLGEAALGAGERVAIAHGGRVLATARTHRGEDSELRVTVVLGPSPTERSRSEPLEVYPIG